MIEQGGEIEPAKKSKNVHRRGKGNANHKGKKKRKEQQQKLS